jgi:hypothetical protein
MSTQFVKFIVSTSGKTPFIIKFYISQFDSTLRFVYDIYQITNPEKLARIDTIDNQFIQNPENENFFKNIPTKLVYTNSFSQLEAGETCESIQKTLTNINTKDIYPIILPPTTRVYYNKKKSMILYYLIKHFYENYELIKLQLNGNENNKTEQLDQPDNNINTEIKKLSSYLFNRYIDLSPNNLISYFIVKYLDNKNSSKKNIIIDYQLDDDKNLIINLSEYDQNFMQFYEDLNVYVLSMLDNIDKIKFKSNIELLIKSLFYLQNIFETNTLSKSEIYYFTYFAILLILLYSISLKASINNDLNIKLPKNIFNYINNVFKSMSANNNKLKTITLKIEKQDNDISQEFDFNLDKINEIAIKYKYLVNIDNEAYVNNIITDYKSISKSSKFEPNDNNIIFTPKILNLEDANNLPLKYELINDNKLKDNKIITTHYRNLLLLNNSSVTLLDLDVDNRLSRLISIITDNLLPNITKYNEMIKLNPSTLLIMDQFLTKTKLSELSISDNMFVLYQIVIPHLYDYYKITKFIDYYH